MRIAEGYGSDNMENVEMEFTPEQEIEGLIALFKAAATFAGSSEEFISRCSIETYPRSGRIVVEIHGSSGEDVLLIDDEIKKLADVETRVQKEYSYINLFIG